MFYVYLLGFILEASDIVRLVGVRNGLLRWATRPMAVFQIPYSFRSSDEASRRQLTRHEAILLKPVHPTALSPWLRYLAHRLLSRRPLRAPDYPVPSADKP